MSLHLLQKTGYDASLQHSSQAHSAAASHHSKSSSSSSQLAQSTFAARSSNKYTGLTSSTTLSEIKEEAKDDYVARKYGGYSSYGQADDCYCSSVIPVYHSRGETFGVQELEDDLMRDTTSYLARRSLLAQGSETVQQTLQTTLDSARYKAERVELERKIHQRAQFKHRMNVDSKLHAPEFTIKLRSHTVWEGSGVQFRSTVHGWPEPVVTWYKNMVPIDVSLKPEKYRVVNKFGVHTLDIYNCEFDDTAQYSATAMNAKGQSSTVASLVVKRFKGELRDDMFPLGKLLPFDMAEFLAASSKLSLHLVDPFNVSFGTEGDTLSLGTTVVLHPPVKGYTPDVQWLRNHVPLVDSKWLKVTFNEGRATLTLPHVNKEDEGLYTVRVTAGRQFQEHSAYLFVRDGEMVGYPGSPLDVECLEVNKDYIIITWKQPSADGGSAIIGFFIDKREVGTDLWLQCNDTPVKFARYPVTGLVEGRSYQFRVRGVNASGIGRPSRASIPTAALDPLDRARMKGGPIAPWTGQIIVTEEEPDEGRIPGPPTALSITEATRNYIVLSWKPPVMRGSEGIMYYIEKSTGGEDNWHRINDELPLKSPRFALFDVVVGQAYAFRVRTCNSSGISEPSETTHHITVGDKLEIPSPPSDVVCSRNTRSSVVVSWKESPTADVVGYYIDSKLQGTDTWVPCNNKPVTGTRFTVHGLVEGETYTLRVKAVNAADVSAPSPESEPIMVRATISHPSAPYALAILESVKDSIVLEWKAPKFSGETPITGYYVDYYHVHEDGSGTWHEANVRAVGERMYRVTELKENLVYKFRVRAGNKAGVGTASDPSESIKCEEWTLAVPGPPHDLRVTEVRKDSLVLLWDEPVYTGRTAVTGYYADLCVAGVADDSLQWRGVNEKATGNKFIKVTGLVEGTTYVFRVRAENITGVGRCSEVTDAVLAETRPGTKEVAVNVDDDGIVYLEFECDKLSPTSEFIWSKNYQDIGDADKARVATETKGNRTKLMFKSPDVEDLGVYSCLVTDTDGVSSSYTLDEDELKRLLELSYDHKNPVVPLLTTLQTEVLEQGQVRFWLQAEKLSPAGQAHFVVNEKEVAAGGKYKINCDKGTGIVEMIMEDFSAEDEGTYTVLLQDGKAKNQSSLVVIGDDFKDLLQQSEFARREYLRKQGPHFVDFLAWEVTEDCNVNLICKVANVKKETNIVWYKDERELQEETDFEAQSGVCKLQITQMAKKDAGIYKVVIWDDRGKDKTTLILTDSVYDQIIHAICKIAAESASELKLQSTAEGIKIYTFVKYYPEDLKVSWCHKDTKLASTDRVRSGVMIDQLWLHINEPAEKDKGKYTVELFDGQETHRRALDLSGQAFDDAYAEFQRLKQAAIAEKNRARVVGGLPDVVTVQQGKTLNLTCNVSGDPAPEVSWLRNEHPVDSDNHLVLKFEAGKFASFTVNGVTTSDSGRYSIVVRNKYGTETGDFTVSVFKPQEGEEEEEEGAAEGVHDKHAGKDEAAKKTTKAK
ncbi:myomesin-1 [Petromyzon marinus]|uniref:myomesin-1 n=1 Tax=Petromyzon marinus TaxID=7757 RepID=UPI003F70C544